MPSVSILIPCYNAERWVAQAIQSALDQTHADKEVIVVDDGSTDGSLEVIKSFGDQIRWETGPNRGGNVARNRLLELSSGEWLQYLDADDYLLPDKVRGQLGEFDWEEVDVAFAPITMEYYQADGSSYRESLPILNDSDPWNLLIRWELPQTGGPLWRRNAIIEVGRWKEDQKCCQEHELYYRLLESQKRFHRCEKSGAIYRVWSDDSVCRRNPMQTNLNRMKVVDRCELHLRTNDQLNATHSAAIAGQRLQIARSIYSIDRKKAVELAAHARGVDGIFESCAANVAPRLYRIAFQLLGFQTAERLAELGRSIKKLVPTSAIGS